MCYATENATILLDSFRHKLVHLAQPSPVIRYGSEAIAWKYHHNDRQFHLKKFPLAQDREIDGLRLDWHISVTHEFHISIMDSVIDINDSTTRPNHYLNLLNCFQDCIVHFTSTLIECWSTLSLILAEFIGALICICHP
jgi:hypothetical protein